MANQNPRPILKGTKSNFTLVHNIGNVSDEKVKEYLKTEILVKEWIEEVLQIKIKESLSDALKNALKDLGFPKQKLFKLNDLYEGESIVRVVECLSQLSKFACQHKGYQIPMKLTPTSTQPIKLPVGEHLNHLKLQLSQIKEYTMDKSNSNQPRMGTAVLKAKMALLAGNSIDFAKCERGFIKFQSLWRGFRVRQFVKHMSKFLYFIFYSSGSSSSSGGEREVAYREKVIQEILKTEEDYVKNLNICIKGYMEPLVSRDVITKDQQKLIFSDIQIIYNFGNKFLDQLRNRCGNNWRVYQKISDLFLQISAFLKVYTSYVQNYNTALETLEELKKKDKQFIQVLNEQKESQQINGKDITSFLIQPVQRVPRYYLLLTDLVKHTWEDHPDLKPLVGAAEKIKDVAAFLNERKREGENFQKFTEIQSILVGKVPQLFTPSRRYIKQISFNPTKKHEIMVYLFNDLIVYGKVMKGIFSGGGGGGSGSGGNNSNTGGAGGSQYSNYNNNNNNNNIINENRKVKYQGMIELVTCVVVDDCHPSPSSHLDIRSNDKDNLLLLTIISKNETEKNNLKIEINKLITNIHENQRSKEQKIIENSSNNNNNTVVENIPEPTIEQQLSERKKTMKRVESNSINSTATTTTNTTTISTTITNTSTNTTSTTPINSPSRNNSSNNIIPPTSPEQQQSVPVSSFISSLFNKKKSSSYNATLSPNKVENNTPMSDSEGSGNTSPQSPSSSPTTTTTTYVDESEKSSPKSSRKKKAQSISMSSSPTNNSNTPTPTTTPTPPPSSEDTNNSNDSNSNNNINAEIQEPPKEKGRPRSKSTSRLSRITGVLTLRKRKTQLVDESQIPTTSDDEGQTSPTSPSKSSIDLSQSQQNPTPHSSSSSSSSSQPDDSSLASSISPLSISTPNPIPVTALTSTTTTTNSTTSNTASPNSSATTHRLSSSSTNLSTNNNECEPSNNKAGSSTSDIQSPTSSSSSPSSSSSTATTNNLSYEKIIAQKSLGELDPLNLETYLSNADFKKLFGVERSEFLKFPKWKQNQKKKDLKLL
ncbi:hypothetical protein ACTFIR_005419 [Dictyostelium discoideum]